MGGILGVRPTAAWLARRRGGRFRGRFHPLQRSLAALARSARFGGDNRPPRFEDRPATMPESALLHELLLVASERDGGAPALTSGDATLGYGALAGAVAAFAGGMCALGLQRGQRVGI